MLGLPTGVPLRLDDTATLPLRVGVFTALPLRVPLPVCVPDLLDPADLVPTAVRVRLRVPLTDARGVPLLLRDPGGVRVLDTLRDTLRPGVPGGDGDDDAAAGVGNGVLVWDGVTGVPNGVGNAVRVGENTAAPTTTPEVTTKLLLRPVTLVSKKHVVSDTKLYHEYPVHAGAAQQARRQPVGVVTWSSSDRTSPCNSE